MCIIAASKIIIQIFRSFCRQSETTQQYANEEIMHNVDFTSSSLAFKNRDRKQCCNQKKNVGKKPLRIEDMPNEMWLSIFNYLDSTQRFLAFHGLNARINQLLISEKFYSLSLSNSIDRSNFIIDFFQVCFDYAQQEKTELLTFRSIYGTDLKKSDILS